MRGRLGDHIDAVDMGSNLGDGSLTHTGPQEMVVAE